jgi:hypothetical protein
MIPPAWQSGANRQPERLNGRGGGHGYRSDHSLRARLVRAVARQSAVAAISVIAATAGARRLGAQSVPIDSAASDSSAPIRRVTVTTPTARFTVYRQGTKPVRVMARTENGTFALVGDSAILARWADSTAALPEPVPQGKKPSLKFWQVRAEGDSGAHMRFARVTTEQGTDLALGLSNGAWGSFELLGAQASALLAALRGDTVGLSDTAHVRRSVSATPRPCRTRDSLQRVVSGETDSSCVQRRSEKQASLNPDSPKPGYPTALLRGGKTGMATLQFVIDVEGHVDVDMRTVRLMAFNDARFALACRAGLPRMQFTPAEVDGHKVRELVTQPCEFAVR